MKRVLTGIASVGILAGDRECTVLSPLRPCSNLYLACLYPQIRGSIRREGVLRTTPFADPNSPEATGGGNIGYNRGLPDGGY